MTEKNHDELLAILETIKNLLILLLEKFEVKKDKIAKMMGISQARLSQILNPKKYKKPKKK